MKSYSHANFLRLISKRGPDRVSRRRKKMLRKRIGRWFPEGPKPRSWYISVDDTLRVIVRNQVYLTPLTDLRSTMDESGRLEHVWWSYQLMVTNPVKFVSMNVEI